MILRQLLLLILTFACLSAHSESLKNRVISSGPHAGKKLGDVILQYSIPGQSEEDSKIPARAVSDTYKFFDKFAGTQRRFQQHVIAPLPENPRVSGFLDKTEWVEGPTIGNQKYIAIFDLNQHASKKRLHIINTETGDIISIEASHGRDTDCGGERLGWACKFISDRESEGTPLGFFATGSMYNGGHGLSVRMNGLEGSLSECLQNPDGSYKTCPGNILPTTIIIHSASYVMEGHAGRSHGCVALSNAMMAEMREKLKDGALFYFYHDSIDPDRPEPDIED